MIIGTCRFADDVLYELDSNTWARFEDGNALATVGINTILAWMGGAFTSVTFKQPGVTIEKGRSLGAVESVRHFETVRSPITGRIISVNDSLVGNPRELNSDPYGGGWFAKLEPLKLSDESSSLKPPALARTALQSKLNELKLKCFAALPDHEMYEIGTECSAVLVRLDELLSSSPVGTVVHLVSDDPTSELEMIRWSDQTGNQLIESRREGNLMHYIVKKTKA